MMDGEAHDDGGPWMLRRLNPEPGVGHGSKVPGDGLIHRRSRDYMEVGYVEAKSRGRVGIVAVEGEISKFHAEVKSRGRVYIVVS